MGYRHMPEEKPQSLDTRRVWGVEVYHPGVLFEILPAKLAQSCAPGRFICFPYWLVHR